MLKLQQERGITFLFIAHDLSMVKYISDRIAVMYFGKIVELGPSEEIYHHPLHDYKNLYFQLFLNLIRKVKEQENVLLISLMITLIMIEH